MKLYTCDLCGDQIYFENSQCVNCGAWLGYVPVVDTMISLEPIGDDRFRSRATHAQKGVYRKCYNYLVENVCNWLIPAAEPEGFCLSCQLNEIIPDLSLSENREYWYRLERAKRRLVYSILRMGLPLQNKQQDPVNGLSFRFLADAEGDYRQDTAKVMVGHHEGRITVNIAEANDAVREKTRLDMNELYRTLLGHFRHEIGHYYWLVLIERNADLIARFRELFGDERVDYTEALNRYYQHGPAADWQQRCVSAYASAHPWEDWAESWAHYLHMFDTLESGSAWGLTVRAKKRTEITSLDLSHQDLSFEIMRDQWIYLSCALNSLNRSMGLKDVYPFVWSKPAIQKLSFIRSVIVNAGNPSPMSRSFE